jgi:hypothetical protein
MPMATDCGFRRWNRLRAQALGSAGRLMDHLRRRCPRGIQNAYQRALYLINMLPIDGRAKQIARVVVIVLGVISLLKLIAVF